MAKPSGAICNLDCHYCFYLEKEKLYPPASGQSWKMNDTVLENYVKKHIEASETPEVNFAWQGGEPTLMGVDFFEKAVVFQKKYAGGKRVSNAFQTNGVLLDDAWGDFLAKNKFLVGLSVDGPEELHDRYRLDKGGQGSFRRVMRGLKVLKKHGVEFNTLTVLQAHNVNHPEKIYRFLKEIGSHYMQFIPLVERVEQGREDVDAFLSPEQQEGSALSKWTLPAVAYGEFLCRVFDLWVKQDVGRYYVQIFDVALGAWLGQRANLCVFEPTCGKALVIEHNGDLYSCDHYVYPEYRVGNILEDDIRSTVESFRQKKFGQDKYDTLPAYCHRCPYEFSCYGGCPKHRFLRTPQGEKGLNYLCAGYRMFFKHVDPYMKFMVNELKHRRPPANIMREIRQKQPGNRNEPCPCGSGKKYKKCCLKQGRA
jgi:uncharacterized protein